MGARDWLRLAVAVVGSLLAGVVGSAFTVSAIPDWYQMLAKPALAPPDWVFGPVWTVLYVLMGVAAFLVWRPGLARKRVRLALVLFVVQLVLNALWSIVFFGLQNPGAALAEIAVLWLAIAGTIAVFANVSKPAAWLMVPYILWVSFAVYLNYAIWMLN